MKTTKIKKNEAELIIAQFVNLYVSPDRDNIRKLFHDDGYFFGLDKERSGRVIKIISKGDQLNHIYCRYRIEVNDNKKYYFSHVIKILMLNRDDFYDATNPSYKAKDYKSGGEFLRCFWLSFKDGKIFELNSNPWKEIEV